MENVVRLLVPWAVLSGAAWGGTVETSLADEVARHYVEQAHARYVDALEAAQELAAVVKRFLDDPSEESHAAAKRAWIEAHSVYSHTEVFRFGNPNVDDWEGLVNAWPMDEGLIDYVAEGYVHHEGNPHAREDIIGTGRAPITDELIGELQEGLDPKAAPIETATVSDMETNVTRGFHAVEFLLWGQDLDRTSRGAGRRRYTDYVEGDGCTNGRCYRRRDYLSAVARLLVIDLEFITRDWEPGGELYSKVFRELSVSEQLDRMIVGMGTMGYGELAAERMEVALLTSDQEEEQSCFSDQTHQAIFHNACSIETLYRGEHRRRDGTTLRGRGLAELVAHFDPELNEALLARFAETRRIATALRDAAEAGEPFDQMILADNEAGRARIRALMDALLAQTELLEEARALCARAEL